MPTSERGEGAEVDEGIPSSPLALPCSGYSKKGRGAEVDERIPSSTSARLPPRVPNKKRSAGEKSQFYAPI